MPETTEFKKLKKNLRKNYLGKFVPKKYQKLYGKRYDLKDVEKMAYPVAKSKGIKIDIK